MSDYTFLSNGWVSKGNAPPQQFAILINKTIPDAYAPGHFNIAANQSITPLEFGEYMEFTAKFNTGELFRGARWFKSWGANNSGKNFPRLLPRQGWASVQNRNTYRNPAWLQAQRTRNSNRRNSNRRTSKNTLRPMLTIDSAIAAKNQIRMNRHVPLPPPPVALQRTGKQKLLLG